MFIEIMPLLSSRTVMITVAREDERTLRVNVIPTMKSGSNENPALTTPLSYTGTAEELDAELGKQLASYVECHPLLGSTLAPAKAEMDAAAKAAQEEARQKAEERRKKAAERTGSLALSAPFCPRAFLLSVHSSGRWMVGAVGIEHDPRTTKSRGMTALQPPTKSNC